MTRRMAWLWLLVPLLSGGCATVAEDESGENKVLVSRGAYQLLQKNDQATAVFIEMADEADSELICERILELPQRPDNLLCAQGAGRPEAPAP